MESGRGPFPFNELIEEMQNEVFSHLPALTTDDLMQARLVNKQFCHAANYAIFNKHNKSSLFAQSFLLKQILTNQLDVKVKASELMYSLRNAPSNFMRQIECLLQSSRLLNVVLTMPFNQRLEVGHLLKGGIYNYHRHTITTFSQLLILYMVSDVTTYPACVDYLLQRACRRDEEFISGVVQALHFGMVRLSQGGIIKALEKIKEFNQWPEKETYWDQQKITLFRPLFRDIASKLSVENIQSYMENLLSDFEPYSTHIFHLLIVEAFADKIDIEEASIITSGMLRRLIHDHTGRADKMIPIILTTLTALASANKLRADQMKECLNYVKKELSYDPAKVAVYSGVKPLAKVLARKMDSEQLLAELKRHLDASYLMAVPFLDAFSSILPSSKLNACLSLIANCFKEKMFVVSAFSIVRENITRLESNDVDILVSGILPYFSMFQHPYYLEIADKWFLSCEEHLSVSSREKCRAAIFASIDVMSVKNADGELAYGHWFYRRLERVATMLSPLTAKKYLPFALEYLGETWMSTDLQERVGYVQSVVAYMDTEDLKAELGNIVDAIPKNDLIVNHPSLLELLSYLSIRGVCQLDELKKMPALSELNKVFSWEILEVMSGWYNIVDNALNQRMNKLKLK